MRWPDLLLERLGRDRGSSTLIARHELPKSAYDLFDGPDGIGVCSADPNATPPVVVSRSNQTDMMDMLGRAAGSATHLHSTFLVEGHRGDTFLLSPDFSPTEIGSRGLGVEIQFQLECSDSPFGSLRACYVFDGESKIEPLVQPLPDYEHNVKVTAPYDRLLDWLHDHTVLLGHLMIDGYAAQAEISTLGYIEGWVSAASTAERSARDELIAYAELRHNAGFVEQLDELDDLIDT